MIEKSLPSETTELPNKYLSQVRELSERVDSILGSIENELLVKLSFIMVPDSPLSHNGTGNLKDVAEPEYRTEMQEAIDVLRHNLHYLHDKVNSVINSVEL